MEAYSDDQEEDVSFSSEGVDLANRLRGIPQDRLIEEIIALWDEVNNLELELIKSKKEDPLKVQEGFLPSKIGRM